VHEAARQANQTFATHVFTQSRAARAQHYEIDRAFKIVNILHRDEALLRISGWINQ
jgi:hypothetical protein